MMVVEVRVKKSLGLSHRVITYAKKSPTLCTTRAVGQPPNFLFLEDHMF
jgi:hypothetical protein